VKQDILLPSEDLIQVHVSHECTIAQLVEVMSLICPLPEPSSDNDEEPIPALEDGIGCILADNLFASQFCHSTIHYCFV